MQFCVTIVSVMEDLIMPRNKTVWRVEHQELFDLFSQMVFLWSQLFSQMVFLLLLGIRLWRILETCKIRNTWDILF